MATSLDWRCSDRQKLSSKVIGKMDELEVEREYFGHNQLIGIFKDLREGMLTEKQLYIESVKSDSGLSNAEWLGRSRRTSQENRMIKKLCSRDFGGELHNSEPLK